MTEEHQFIFNITLGAAIIGAVAGLAGTLLVPVLSSQIEKMREKRNLKSDLVKNIYLFFDYRKRSVNKLNRVRFNELSIRYIRGQSTLNKVLSDDHKALMDKLEAQIHSEELLSQELTTKESEIEAEITMTLQNILHHYGQKTFTRIESIIQPHIDLSNDARANELFDYENVTSLTYKSVAENMEDKIVDA